MKKTIKIVVVGSINYDVTIYVARFARPGETVSARGYQAVCGGKGLNQAVAASRIGADVSMVGCVGDDDFGGKALAHLARNGVDTALCKRGRYGHRVCLYHG